MKKSNILRVVAPLLALSLVAGCSTNKDNTSSSGSTPTSGTAPSSSSVAPTSSTSGQPGVITVTEVSMAGLQTDYLETASIDWSSLNLNVSYSDGNSDVFTAFEFDVTEKTDVNTQALINTHGLHGQATLSEGTYQISAVLVDYPGTEYNLGTIKINSQYTVRGATHENITFDYPEFVSKYLATKLDFASDDPTKSESSFKLDAAHADPYTVGTFNTFQFLPVATWCLDGDYEHIFASNSYAKTWAVSVVDGVNKTEAPDADYDIINDEGVKFNESAIGKTMEISVQATEFEEELITFQVKVEKGFNVYNAKQLGVLNLTKYTDEQLADLKITEHAGVKNNVRVQNGAEKVFWQNNTYDYIQYNKVWKDFLIGNNTFKESDVSLYGDTPAVFFHDDITINKGDIPSEYFVVENEAGNKSGEDARTGTFRDAACVYLPMVFEQDVTINGNYFKLDISSEFGVCNNNWKIGEGKTFGVYPKEVDNVEAGHAVLFKFCSYDYEDNRDPYYEAQTDVANGFKGIVKNLNSVGNAFKRKNYWDLATDSEKMLQVTAFIFAKNTYCGAVFENNIIKQYQIGLFGDAMVGQNYGGHEQTNRTFIRDTKIYDCSNCGIFNYQNGGISITNSNLERFGGSAIMNAGSEKENRCANTSIGNDVEFDNYIYGQEAYISAMGATGQIAQFQNMENLFSHYGFHIGKTIDAQLQFNIATLMVDGDGYLEAQNGVYYNSMDIGGAYTASAYSLPMAALAKLQSGPIFTTDAEANPLFINIGSTRIEEVDGTPITRAISANKYVTVYVPIPTSGAPQKPGFTVLIVVFRVPQ